VLEIGVLDQQDVSCGGGKAAAHGGTLAAVDIVLDQLDRRVSGGGQDAQVLTGAVGREVVDHHDLELDVRRQGRTGDALEQRRDTGALVVDRDDHGELGHASGL